MRMFLRKAALSRDPLPMTMAGVRLGERVLQIGLDDPVLASAMAAKAGLSGQAAIVVPTEESAERARRGAATAGVLIDVHRSSLDALPFAAGAFDVVVIHSASGLLASMTPAVRGGMLQQCHRVLRSGGRAIAIESAPKSGLTAWIRGGAHAGDYERTGGAVGAMESAGFKPVRLLGEREGFRFTEGLKGAAAGG